jgi:excisionase family DNA binding protein
MFVHIILKNIMENPFAQIEQRLNSIEDLLLNLLARIDQIEKPETEIFGDIEECSGWIKKSTSTIYKYVSENKIPHIKNGKRVLFNKEQIMIWLNADTRATLSEIRSEVDCKLRDLQKSRARA